MKKLNFIIEKFQKTLDFLELKSKIKTIPFLDYKKGNKKMPGNYVIYDSVLDLIIYSGLGYVFVRQLHHERKALNAIGKGTKDTSGFKWLREHYNFDMKNWTLVYAQVDEEIDQTAVEGVLIKFLKPICNKETYKYRKVA